MVQTNNGTAAKGTPTNGRKNKKDQQSPSLVSPSAAAPRRTRANSESEKSKFSNSTPNNKNLLQISLMNKSGLSPLATSLSESDASTEDCPSEKKKNTSRTIKSKCPCNISSEGKSWNLPCSQCGQTWHNRCANLIGSKLTQESVDSMLPNWQCPWCFVCPFPRPKSHKSAKLEASLHTTSYANEISSQVIESLESMVERKLAALTGPTDKLVEAIQGQLMELTNEISSLKERPAGPPIIRQTFHHPPEPPKPQYKVETKTVKVEETNLNHSTKHIERLIDDFITEEEEIQLRTVLDLEDFTAEGDRAVVQYGEHYKYMGSRTKPKIMPDPIKKIMDRLNSEFGKSHRESRYHYSLNSCLVNLYRTKAATLPEHADDEGDIDPKSSIFTLSLGAARHISFRDLQSKEETSLLCKGRSLYEMTRHSQDFFKHSLHKEQDQEADGVRYSLTFRAIHWSNFNSTALIGDSNFGHVMFGEGKGKVGGSTPGVRFWAPKVESVDPLCCSSFKNVVVMVGTNDLKNKMPDNEINDLYRNYKTKIALIRKYNKKSKICL